MISFDNYVDFGGKVVNGRTNPAAVAADAHRKVLAEQVKQLLSTDSQVDRQLARRGFTPDEASVLRQAGEAGLLNGLVKVDIEDPYSHARRIEFYGDDDGRTWEPFANPLKIGRFAELDKAAIAAAQHARKGWWQA